MVLFSFLFVSVFIDAQNKGLLKDVKDFSKSTGKMVKEGVKIIKEDPNSIANRLMNDEKYQKIYNQQSKSIARQPNGLINELKTHVTRLIRVLQLS